MTSQVSERREIARLRDALQMIADETLIPEAFPGFDHERLVHASALLIARAALEGSSSHHATAERCLREFAQAVLRNWQDMYSLDAGDLQELAIQHQLLEPVTVTEPCHPARCACAAVAAEFPQVCYRGTAILTGEVSVATITQFAH